MGGPSRHLSMKTLVASLDPSLDRKQIEQHVFSIMLRQ